MILWSSEVASTVREAVPISSIHTRFPSLMASDALREVDMSESQLCPKYGKMSLYRCTAQSIDDAFRRTCEHVEAREERIQLFKTDGTDSLVMSRAVRHDFTLEIFDVVQNRIAVIIGQ
jgi:hypothetical protein